MNMVAIYGARVPALLGAMVMAGAAAAADLPYDYSYQNGFYGGDYGHHPCCESCCDHRDGGGRWWGPAVNVHVAIPWERRRDTGWVTRNYVERRFPDDSPFPEFRQYRSVSRYERDPRDDFGPAEFGPAPAAFERRDPYSYRFDPAPPPFDYRPAYFERRRFDEPLDRPPGLVPGGW